jgi:hypothetical protein
VRCTVTLGRSAAKPIATDVDTLGITRKEQEPDSVEGLRKEYGIGTATCIARSARRISNLCDTGWIINWHRAISDASDDKTMIFNEFGRYKGGNVGR